MHRPVRVRAYQRTAAAHLPRFRTVLRPTGGLALSSTRVSLLCLRMESRCGARWAERQGANPGVCSSTALALRGALRRRGCACATAAAAAAATAAIAVGYGAVVRLLSGSYVEAASGRRRRRCWAATSTGERRRRG